MKIKIFGEKKIKIRKLFPKDIKRYKEFQDYINSLIKEETKILFNQELTLKEEKVWLVDTFKQVKKHKKVFIIAEHNNKIVGEAEIDLDRGRRDHIGNFSISIKNGYRGIGLGKYLTEEILKLARRELRPKPKIIRLSVFANNKSAISLYEKCGFKKVAAIPKQMQYKKN